MLQGVSEKPKQSTISMFDQLLDGFYEGQNDECFVTDEELKDLEDKTYRHLKLREMLLAHSFDASLIVMSLPMPRKVNLIETRKHFHLKSSILGQSFRATLHGLAGSSHQRYASVSSGSWQSNICFDFWFLTTNHKNHKKSLKAHNSIELQLLIFNVPIFIVVLINT